MQFYFNAAQYVENLNIFLSWNKAVIRLQLCCLLVAMTLILTDLALKCRVNCHSSCLPLLQTDFDIAQNPEFRRILPTMRNLNYIICEIFVFCDVVFGVAVLHKPACRPNPIPYRQCRLTDLPRGFVVCAAVPCVVLRLVALVSEPDTIRWRHSPRTLFPAPTRWQRCRRYGQWKSHHRFCRPG